jgi:hypothetical protein
MSGMRLLILIATAIAAVPGLGSAQSVLERVLNQIDGATNFAQINGIYANIAESGPAAVDTYLASAADSVRVFQISGPGPGGGRNYWVTVGDLGVTILAATTGFYDDVAVGADGTVTIVNATNLVPGDSYTVLNVTLTTTQIVSDTAGSAATLAGGEIVFSDGANSFLAAETVGLGLGWDKVSQYIPTAIDGSITNIITDGGMAPAEVVAGAVTAGRMYVQVGVFGDASNAAQSVQRLQGLGLPVAKSRITSKGRNLQIVMAGPFGDAGSANAALSAARRAGFGDAFIR